MASYFRGWKGSSSRHAYNQRLDPRAIIRPKKWRGLWRRMFFGKSFWKTLVAAGVMAGILGFVVFGTMFAYYSFTLPDPSKLRDRVPVESTKIYDRNAKLLYEIHGEAKRELINIADIPIYAKQATIAIEDKDFYKHGGISITGIIRSALKNLFTGSRVGGSTITQQFVRNAVLTREKTYTRKLKEVVLSMQMERKYTKDEILQLYLNEIPYGSNAYGIQAASQTFFGKNARDLTLAESAYLAALPQAPTYYSPFGPHKDDLDARADTALRLMAEQGHITQQQKKEAQAQEVQFRELGQGILAPHFVMYVQDLLAEKFGEISLREGGLKVTTALDLDLQVIAEEAVARQVVINEKNYAAGNAALVAIDPKNGQILAMVGSRDYFDEEHDGAVNVSLRPRQPGSSFKPYVYAAAFKNGMNPATMLMDVETNFGQFGGQDYLPHNYDGAQHGPVSIRQALAGSLNVPAVKTLLLVGIDEAIEMAERLGISTLHDRSRFGPSLVLGGGEVKLLDHVSAFGVLAAGGIRHEPTAILKIENNRGDILEEFKESRGKEVLDPQIAYQISHVLSDNEARAYIFGRSNRLTLPDRPVAAKTGTTQDYHDAWTMGYTPSLAAGVWVGNSDNAAMKTRADGSVVAAPIWNEFMRRALEGKPVEQFTRPEGISEIAVDALSGKLPSQYTQTTKTEIFADFNAPTEADNVHVAGGYTILHAEKPDDPAWENPVRAWAESHGYPYPPENGGQNGSSGDVSISVAAPAKVTGYPWSASAAISAAESVTKVEFLLDSDVIATKVTAPYEIITSEKRADGQHTFAVQVYTAGGMSHRSVTVEFASGQNLLLLYPQNNQILTLPANIVLETTQDVAVENSIFYARPQAGTALTLSGKVTKQQVSAKVFRYTLNWSAGNKPPAGSYAVYAKLGNALTGEAVVKIQ